MPPRIVVKPSSISYPLGIDVGHIELNNDGLRFVTINFDDRNGAISLDVSLKNPDERAAFRYIIDQILKHIDEMEEE
jgi:hypothetical protein